MKEVRGIENREDGERTGSSALLVLLRVAEAPFTSSIMLVRSLPISSKRSDSFSANLYLYNNQHQQSFCCYQGKRNIRSFTLLIRTL